MLNRLKTSDRPSDLSPAPDVFGRQLDDALARPSDLRCFECRDKRPKPVQLMIRHLQRQDAIGRRPPRAKLEPPLTWVAGRTLRGDTEAGSPRRTADTRHTAVNWQNA